MYININLRKLVEPVVVIAAAIATDVVIMRRFSLFSSNFYELLFLWIPRAIVIIVILFHFSCLFASEFVYCRRVDGIFSFFFLLIFFFLHFSHLPFILFYFLLLLFILIHWIAKCVIIIVVIVVVVIIAVATAPFILESLTTKININLFYRFCFPLGEFPHLQMCIFSSSVLLFHRAVPCHVCVFELCVCIFFGDSQQLSGIQTYVTVDFCILPLFKAFNSHCQYSVFVFHMVFTKPKQ